MNYPRELKLDQHTLDRLISYLDTEITNHEAERSNWVADLRAWQSDYWAEPKEKVKTIPFRNACNLVIPLTAISVEAIHAREMTTLFALDEFVNIKPALPFEDATHGIEKVANHVLLKDVDIYNAANQTLLERTKLGTCVAKSGYEKIERRAVRSEGGEDKTFTVVTRQGPTVTPVPLASFLMPFTSDDPQRAPWCGEEHRSTPYAIRQLAYSGFFRKEVADEILVYMGQKQSHSSEEYVQEQREQADQTPVDWNAEILWHEIWLGFDVDGDDQDEEIVVHYHRPTRSFFSIRYNWYSDLRRPYRTAQYFPREHRWAGIGVGKQNEQFQKEVTVQHRQRIDNATLANMRMYKVRKGIGYGDKEPVFPGKIWLLDNMDDLDSFAMAEVYPSSYNNEQQAVIYSQQRTGVNELTLGMPQAGTPGTATGDLARVQEGNRKFDYTYKNARRFLEQLSVDALCEASQFGYRDARIFDLLLDPASAVRVREFLTQPPEALQSQLTMELSLVGQNANKLIDRQSQMQVGQSIQQYYQGMIQLAGMVNPQMVPMIAQQGMVAATEAMKQFLEAFDFRAVNKIIVSQVLTGQMNGGPNGSPVPSPTGQPQGAQPNVPMGQPAPVP